MSEPEFPPVDPTNFDLIIVGTGLPESITAAASSTAGKSVLHLDPNPFYGSHFSSLSPLQLPSFLSPPPPPSPPFSLSSSDDEFSTISLSSSSLYSSLEIPPFPDDLPNLRNNGFNLDVSGPRVLFCADDAIELMMKSGVSDYMEFKSIDESLIYDEISGKLQRVPDSKNAIFNPRSYLKGMEKTQMGRIYKLVKEHLEAMERGEREGLISEEDLERPFVEFLTSKNLPHKIKSIILYALSMADYDQENVEGCKDLLKTKDGINRLALYHKSYERFPNAKGAMLYPMYGQGELPQAFCRRAAVKGCIYVLRMPIAAVLVDKDSGIYKGVRLASGQNLFSQRLVTDPHIVVPQALTLSKCDASPSSPRDIKGKVARAVCITSSSLKSDASNLLIVFPPRSLYPEQATTVRALQLGGTVAVCPVGMFVLYLSALCDDAGHGKKLLTAAINAVLKQQISGSSGTTTIENPENCSEADSAGTNEEKPILLWSALYVQDITKGSVDTVSVSPSPDGNLSYNDLVEETKKMFHQLYPDEEFFPEKASSEDAEDGDRFDPE